MRSSSSHAWRLTAKGTSGEHRLNLAVTKTNISRASQSMSMKEPGTEDSNGYSRSSGTVSTTRKELLVSCRITYAGIVLDVLERKLAGHGVSSDEGDAVVDIVDIDINVDINTSLILSGHSAVHLPLAR